MDMNIIKLKTVCRLCLCNNSVNEKVINLDVKEMIIYCIGRDISFSESELVSNTICSKCYTDLKKYRQFKTKCLKLQDELEEYLNNISNQNNTKHNALNEETKLPKKELNIHCGTKQNLAECEGSGSNNECIKTAVDFVKTSNHVCPTCGKVSDYSFPYASYLQVHYRSHTGERLILCNICGKSFSRTGHLNIHMRTHTNERPFMCDICGKKFYQNCDLKVHSRIHTGIKNYSCKQCGKSFITSSALYKHNKIHTGYKSFNCDKCEKGFYELNSLQRHQRIHNGIKLFKCEKCNKCFSQCHILSKHLKMHESL